MTPFSSNWRNSKLLFINIGEEIIQRVLIHLRLFGLFQLYPNDIASNLVILKDVIGWGNR